MAAAERLILLQERNPFASAWAGDPWEGGYPDVPTINEKAFNGICRLLTAKASDLSSGMGGIVVGETGEGKTHLIARILKHTKGDIILDVPTFLAYDVSIQKEKCHGRVNSFRSVFSQ